MKASQFYTNDFLPRHEAGRRGRAALNAPGRAASAGDPAS